MEGTSPLTTQRSFLSNFTYTYQTMRRRGKPRLTLAFCRSFLWSNNPPQILKEESASRTVPSAAAPISLTGVIKGLQEDYRAYGEDNINSFDNFVLLLWSQELK